MPASITYTPTGGSAYEFHLHGRPAHGRVARYEADAQGGRPRRAIVTYSITEWFMEPSFADNQQRLAALITALRGTEGVLVILDENDGELVNVTCRPEQHSLPEQWGQTFLETTVSFVAREELCPTSPGAATFQPNNVGDAINLENPHSWKESIHTTRYSTLLHNRREATCNIVASGRLHADPNLGEAERRQWLEAQKARIEAASDCKSGTLIFGDFNREVQIDVLDGEITDSDRIDWTLSASYVRFPDGEYAEAEFNATTKEDIEKHEVLTTVKGKIRAETADGARTKAAAIRAAYASSGQLRIIESDEQRVSGYDGDAFIELTFNYEWRAVSDSAVSWTLSVSDKNELRAGQIVTTYSGTVTAVDTSTALTKARLIGDNKYPMRTTATETINTSALADGSAQLREVTFSYEYLRKGSWQYAEVNGEINSETFGSSTQSVSGFAVAATKSDALTLARSFKLGDSYLLRSAKETDVSDVKATDTGTGTGTGTLFVRVDFNYVYQIGSAAVSITYHVKTAIDYNARESIVTYSGMAYGPTQTEADTVISALVSGVSGRKITDERESAFDASGSLSIFMGRSFTISRGQPLG